MQRYRKLCSSSDRGTILKVLAKLTNRTGFDSALQTVDQALLYQVKDPDSLKNLYRRLYADVPEPPPLPQQNGVPKIVQMPVDLPLMTSSLGKEVEFGILRQRNQAGM